ncbi:Hypothetical protein PHPALM_15798, partial [Phytophthora palmivora]
MELKRLGVWKKTVIDSVPSKEWAFALLDCAYSVLVVLNFYETTTAAEVQVMAELLIETTESNLMDEVDNTVMYLAVGFSTVLGVSLLARCPNFFAVGVVGVKLALLPVSIYIFAVVFVNDNLITPKRGVNALVADLVCAIAAARAVDSLGRAFEGLGRSAVGLPGADAVKGSSYEKASIALQVFWDRFNDFLVPLGIVHLVISTTNVGKNFIVIYFLLVVCVLHAMIAYVDAIDITSATYLAERLGYLVAVTFLVRNSSKYVEREGMDLFAPVLLVAMEFMLLVVALISLWKARQACREMEKADANVVTIDAPLSGRTRETMKVITVHITGFYHSSFHAYTTEVNVDGHRWRLGLRYSKFHEFYEQLVDKKKDFHAEFPPKGTLFFTPKPEERQEQLEVFIQHVLEYYTAKGRPTEVEELLCDLLKVPRHLRSPEHEDDDVSTSTESVLDDPIHEPPTSSDGGAAVEKTQVAETKEVETVPVHVESPIAMEKK